MFPNTHNVNLNWGGASGTDAAPGVTPPALPAPPPDGPDAGAVGNLLLQLVARPAEEEEAGRGGGPENVQSYEPLWAPPNPSLAQAWVLRFGMPAPPTPKDRSYTHPQIIWEGGPGEGSQNMVNPPEAGCMARRGGSDSASVWSDQAMNPALQPPQVPTFLDQPLFWSPQNSRTMSEDSNPPPSYHSFDDGVPYGIQVGEVDSLTQIRATLAEMNDWRNRVWGNLVGLQKKVRSLQNAPHVSPQAQFTEFSRAVLNSQNAFWGEVRNTITQISAGEAGAVERLLHQRGQTVDNQIQLALSQIDRMKKEFTTNMENAIQSWVNGKIAEFGTQQKMIFSNLQMPSGQKPRRKWLSW